MPPLKRKIAPLGERDVQSHINAFFSSESKKYRTNIGSTSSSPSPAPRKRKRIVVEDSDEGDADITMVEDAHVIVPDSQGMHDFILFIVERAEVWSARIGSVTRDSPAIKIQGKGKGRTTPLKKQLFMNDRDTIDVDADEPDAIRTSESSNTPYNLSNALM